MSLLDAGPDAIVVYPSVWEADADGNYAWRPGTMPVLVWARVQPVNSTELVVNGQQVVTLARVIARRAPAGPWDRIDYDRRTWDVLGEPEQRGDSPTTRHVTVLMQARGPHREASRGRG
ncbi:hypothetical protein [Actinophytocola sp.]|uniref:hypothetical protein n=1 Tax=Actinophytocola sp. TaxID=1872138 RepID=UPI003D6B3D9C